MQYFKEYLYIRLSGAFLLPLLCTAIWSLHIVHFAVSQYGRCEGTLSTRFVPTAHFCVLFRINSQILIRVLLGVIIAPHLLI